MARRAEGRKPTSHAVNDRRREVALRVAVGVSGSEVVRLAMREAMFALGPARRCLLIDPARLLTQD